MQFLALEDLRSRGFRASRSTLLRKEAANPPRFPRRTRFGEARHAWAEPVITAYAQALAAGLDEAAATALAERARPRRADLVGGA